MNGFFIPDQVNQANKTPIETLLHVDDDKTVSAKKVYEFLELRQKDYSRWCKTNILGNQYAEENVDFVPFRVNAECGGQATTDYKLSVSFAKKLCMLQHNERGEQARKYFIAVEEKLKEVVQAQGALMTVPQPPAITNPIQALETFFMIIKSHDGKLEELNNRFDVQCAAYQELSDKVNKLKTKEILVPVEQIINTDVGDLIRKLPSSELTSTERIAKMYGYSAQSLNIILLEMGIIERNESSGWRLSDENRARGFGITVSSTSKCRSFIRWSPSGKKFIQESLKKVGLEPIRRLPPKRRRLKKAVKIVGTKPDLKLAE